MNYAKLNEELYWMWNSEYNTLYTRMPISCTIYFLEHSGDIIHMQCISIWRVLLTLFLPTWAYFRVAGPCIILLPRAQISSIFRTWTITLPLTCLCTSTT